MHHHCYLVVALACKTGNFIGTVRTGEGDHVGLREPIGGEDLVELVQVEEGRRQLPVDAALRRAQPVQPPQLHRVRRAAGLIDPRI